MYLHKTHISPNRHSWNLRQVETLGKEINSLERELRTAKGLIHRLRLKSKLRSLTKRQNSHGEEVLSYEYSNKN